MKFYFIGYIRKLKFTPNVGLEPRDPEIKSLRALPTELAGHCDRYFEEGKYDIQVN